MSGQQGIRQSEAAVLIAGPHPFFRLGVITMVRGLARPARIREAGTTASVLAALREDSFDLAIIDLTLVEAAGDTMRDGLRAAGAPPVIAFGEAPWPTIRDMSRAIGTVAAFSRNENPRTVRMAVENVLGSQRGLDRRLPPTRDGNGVLGLTDRQREVHQLMLKGLPNKEIARRLGLSPNTVKVHMTLIFKKLGIASRYQALVPH